MSVADDHYAPGDVERAVIVTGLMRDKLSSLHGVTVLDLACRTGVISQGVAATGAVVTGIEGKAENLDRAPRTSNLTFHLDDVRNLSVEGYGTFDVTLCLGLLYHLEAEAAVALLGAMRRVTKSFAIVDTHISLADLTEEAPPTVVVGDATYCGHPYNEEPPSLWSSLGNPEAWWFTMQSLKLACWNAGWDNIELRDDVTWSGQQLDRRWLVLS